MGRPRGGLPAGPGAGTSTYGDVFADARLELGATACHPAAWGRAVNAAARAAIEDRRRAGLARPDLS